MLAAFRFGTLGSEARSLVKKLQAARSPAADVLDQRISLIERCQVLGFKESQAAGTQRFDCSCHLHREQQAAEAAVSPAA